MVLMIFISVGDDGDDDGDCFSRGCSNFGLVEGVTSCPEPSSLAPKP